MSTFWIVLLKIMVMSWVILLLCLTMAVGIEVSLRLREKKETPPEEVERNEHGVVIGCPNSEMCAAVVGVLEREIESERVQREYDELYQKYSRTVEAFKRLKEDYEALEKKQESEKA